MPPTTPSRRGDVVRVPFPFTDLSTAKQRPAVVLSSERYHRATEDCLVAAITSVGPATLVGKLITLDRRLIRRTLGRLPDATMGVLLAEVKGLFIDP